MALSADTTIKYSEGDTNEYTLKSAATVYRGSMVGKYSSDGTARALTAGDIFLGHAVARADYTTDGDRVVDVYQGGPTAKDYVACVTLASVAATDVGSAVYASDDATYTLTVGSNSLVGKVLRYVTTNTCEVLFQPIRS